MVWAVELDAREVKEASRVSRLGDETPLESAGGGGGGGNEACSCERMDGGEILE